MKTAAYDNIECKITGTKLHIVVELDPAKVRANALGFLSSTLRQMDSPAGRIEVNLSIRPLKPGEVVR